MEKISRELLIKEISSRLPYGIKAQVFGWDEEKGEVGVPLKVYSINTDGYLSFEYNHYNVETVYVEDCHLYLRPMSSMAEEEFIYFMGIRGRNLPSHEIQMMMKEALSLPQFLSIAIPLGSYYKKIDWLNKNMFDYRGLIPMGLAIEAPEGMYGKEAEQ